MGLQWLHFWKTIHVLCESKEEKPFNLGVISAVTLLDDADPVLCHPLGCFVSLCLGISCHFFCVIELSSEDQIPVILPKYKKNPL